MSAVPPCAGRWELFDSTDLEDHAYAASLCRECPIVAECRARLKVARERSLTGQKAGIQYGPQGTWAGMPVGETLIRAKRANRRAEEAMFTDDELRDGHASYAAGDRSEGVRTAERVYQRKRKQRNQRKSRVAA